MPRHMNSPPPRERDSIENSRFRRISSSEGEQQVSKHPCNGSSTPRKSASCDRTNRAATRPKAASGNGRNVVTRVRARPLKDEAWINGAWLRRVLRKWDEDIMAEQKKREKRFPSRSLALPNGAGSYFRWIDFFIRSQKYRSADASRLKMECLWREYREIYNRMI